jgi:hypothetical protein
MSRPIVGRQRHNAWKISDRRLWRFGKKQIKLSLARPRFHKKAPTRWGTVVRPARAIVGLARLRVLG